MGCLLVNADGTVSRVVADVAGQAVRAEMASRTLEEYGSVDRSSSPMRDCSWRLGTHTGEQSWLGKPI